MIAESRLAEPNGETANHHEKRASRSAVFCRCPTVDSPQRKPSSDAVRPPCTATRAIGGRVGRYYDPATDQFLSVDPDLAETGQPYAFTADDPLNSTDPLGLGPSNQFGQNCGGDSLSNCHETPTQESGTGQGGVSGPPPQLSVPIQYSGKPVTVIDSETVTVTVEADVTVSGPKPYSNITFDSNGGVKFDNGHISMSSAGA